MKQYKTSARTLVALCSFAYFVSYFTRKLLPERELKHGTCAPVSQKYRETDNKALHLAVLAGLPTVMLANVAMGFLRDGIKSWLPTFLAALISALMHAINFLLISCLLGRFAPYGRAATVSGVSNAFTYLGGAISMVGFFAVSTALGWRAVILL